MHWTTAIALRWRMPSTRSECARCFAHVDCDCTQLRCRSCRWAGASACVLTFCRSSLSFPAVLHVICRGCACDCGRLCMTLRVYLAHCAALRVRDQGQADVSCELTRCLPALLLAHVACSRFEAVCVVMEHRSDVVLPATMDAPEVQALGGDSVLVSWPAVVTRRPAPAVCGYRVSFAKCTPRGSISSKWTTYSGAITASPMEIAGLEEGAWYVARVAALSKYGRGSWSSPSRHVCVEAVTPRAALAPSLQARDAMSPATPGPVPVAPVTSSGSPPTTEVMSRRRLIMHFAATASVSTSPVTTTLSASTSVPAISVPPQSLSLSGSGDWGMASADSSPVASSLKARNRRNDRAAAASSIAGTTVTRPSTSSGSGASAVAADSVSRGMYWGEV